MTKTYRIAMIGFGNVGQGFAQILTERADMLAENYGVSLSSRRRERPHEG